MTTSQNLLETFLKYRKISTDSRNILPESIFFALRGENFNGNLYAKEALKKGAARVVVDQDLPEIEVDQKIEVPDVLAALQQLAKDYRNTLQTTVIGLTGSNGKTTCKELFRDVLSQKYRTAATTGNLNNHIGVPLTVLSIPEEAEMAVVEMGANHQGEIAFLSDICKPDWGFITNYGKAHLEGFGGVEGVIKGKSELYDFLRANQRKALVCGDDLMQIKKSEGINRITFGQNPDNNYLLTLVAGEMAGLEYKGTLITSQLTGSFQYTNLAAAVTLGLIFQIDLKLIKTAIENYRPQMNRVEWRHTTHNEVLMDAYNANPDSTMASAVSFLALQKPNKWIILGDMFELGEYAGEEHQKIVDYLRSEGAENVFLIGNHYCKTQSNYHSFQSTQEAAEALRSLHLKGCTVLLKGSRGMKLEQLLEVL